MYQIDFFLNSGQEEPDVVTVMVNDGVGVNRLDLLTRVEKRPVKAFNRLVGNAYLHWEGASPEV